MTVYLKIKDTRPDSVIERVNRVLIETKSTARISEDNIACVEIIPYDGLTPIKEYMITARLSVNNDTDLKALADAFAQRGIGLVTKPMDSVSVMISTAVKDKAAAISALEEYGLGKNAAKNALDEVLDIMLKTG